MAGQGYIDPACDQAVDPEGTQPAPAVEYDYVDGGTVPEAPEADTQDYSEADPDDDYPEADPHYRAGPLTEAELERAGDTLTTAGE